tara:strand:+ start:616 stop:1095 length:480 start_codon:yes stop_codon:yes gene_type:complete
MELNAPVGLTGIGWDPMLRLLCAALAGLLLGVDREFRGHGAGLRTNAIACFGAALMTVSALALWHQLGGGATRMDPLRVLQGTATVIGVLAAALVVYSNGQAQNLTTAVHLWLVTGIGIAFGAGQYPLGLFSSVVALVLLIVVGAMERRWMAEDDDGKD